MANIGKVVLSLEAQSEAFTRGCKESVAATHELGESVEGIKGLIEGAFAFVGIEVGVGCSVENLINRLRES